MDPLAQFCGLLVTHWVADFVLQTHWQASNKSKNNIALARHVSVYTGILAIASAFLFDLSVSTLWFVLANGICHFITDYHTSRASSKLFGDWHNFFVVIGFDQLIHQLTLAITLVLFTIR